MIMEESNGFRRKYFEEVFEETKCRRIEVRGLKQKRGKSQEKKER